MPGIDVHHHHGSFLPIFLIFLILILQKQRSNFEVLVKYEDARSDNLRDWEHPFTLDHLTEAVHPTQFGL